MNWKDNIPPFLPGTKVVAIGTLKSGGSVVNKGQVFTVLGLMKCCEWLIDIGLKTDYHQNCECSRCDTKFKTGDILWATARGFVPLQSQSFPLIKLTEIKEREREEVLISN